MSEWKQLYAEVLDREPPASLSVRISILTVDAHADEPKTVWSRRLAIGLAAAAVTVAVLVVLALAAHSRYAAPPPRPTHKPPASTVPRFHGVPAEGNRPTPTGKLVMGFRLIDESSGSDSFWTVYADGLIVSQRWNDAWLATIVPSGATQLDTGYVQQRLTRQGVELLRSRILATGLFKHDLTVSSDPWLRAEVRRGDHLIELVAYPGQNGDSPTKSGQRRAIRKIEALITGLGSWLPSAGWADRTIRPFVPSHYFVEFDGSDSKIASPRRKLPAPARDLVRSASRCGVITTAQARALLQALFDVGVAPSRNVPRGIQYDWNALGVIHHGGHYSLMTVLPLTASRSRIEPQACRAR